MCEWAGNIHGARDPGKPDFAVNATYFAGAIGVRE